MMQPAFSLVCPDRPSQTNGAALSVRLGPDADLTSETVEEVALSHRAAPSLTPAARAACTASFHALDRLVERNVPIYGITTGFGPFVAYGSSGEGDATHGLGLLSHLMTGTGAWAPAPVVRATMLVRAQALSQGFSGVGLDALGAYLGLLRHHVTPAVPEIGSVGASGDLTPLAHIARVLTGTGQVLTEGGTRPALEALEEAGLTAHELRARDALGLVNGTSFMTGYAALAVARAQRLLEQAERLTGWLYALLGASHQALDDRLHAARGHDGQRQSAAAIRREACRLGARPHPDRPLQEVYSVRCAPQILGACREQLDHARRLIEAEANGANDNPVICADKDEVLHGGNFQGQQVAFAADTLNAALTQVGVLVERQIAVLLSPERNGGAPLLLAWEPGATSGLAGAQITSTALVAELRHHAQMTAVSSIPTNGDNQDVVSMGTLAARAAYGQTERLAPILAVAGIALAQLTHLRRHARADGPTVDVPDWMPPFEPLRADRPLHADLNRIAAAWLRPPAA